MFNDAAITFKVNDPLFPLFGTSLGPTNSSLWVYNLSLFACSRVFIAACSNYLEEMLCKEETSLLYAQDYFALLSCAISSCRAAYTKDYSLSKYLSLGVVFLLSLGVFGCVFPIKCPNVVVKDPFFGHLCAKWEIFTQPIV